MYIIFYGCSGSLMPFAKEMKPRHLIQSLVLTTKILKKGKYSFIMIDYRLFKFHTDDKIPGQKSKLISMGPPLRLALPQAPRPQPISPRCPPSRPPPVAEDGQVF